LISFAGRLLAQSGHSTSITLAGCAFEPVAKEAFVDGMLSKTNKNYGLTKLHFVDTLSFHFNQTLVHLMMSEYGPIEFSHSLHNSPRLQSLELYEESFTSNVLMQALWAP